MLKTDIKSLMDELAKRYETEDFIKDDPVQFPHRYHRAEDIEIAGFIASIFAYGNRKAFIAKLNQLFALMGESPCKYILEGHFELNGFNYRFMKENDTLCCIYSDLDCLKGRKIFVTVDLDVLDPSVMPGTGTPESGGFSFNQLIEWFEYLKDFDIVGADVVELAPDYDASGVSTAVATKVIRELLMIM